MALPGNSQKNDVPAAWTFFGVSQKQVGTKMNTKLLDIFSSIIYEL